MIGCQFLLSRLLNLSPDLAWGIVENKRKTAERNRRPSHSLDRVTGRYLSLSPYLLIDWPYRMDGVRSGLCALPPGWRLCLCGEDLTVSGLEGEKPLMK